MRTSMPFVFIVISALCSCGLQKDDRKKFDDSPFGPSGIPPQLRAKQDQAGGVAVAPGGNMAPAPSTAGLTPDS